MTQLKHAAGQGDWPRIHLCVMQPAGDLGPLGFLDHVRYFRWQFRRLGAEVTIGRNRLRQDAVNYVFGAHLEVAAVESAHAPCVVVNLEQLGPGGKPVSPEYLGLLGNSPVVDYEHRHPACYGRSSAEVPVVTFGHAPYLQPPGGPLPLNDRPIDLLFIGSLNARRLQILGEVQAAGVQVLVPRGTVFGEERDQLVKRAKAVFNCHFYEAAVFEQARVFHCLSLGTPVISERTPATRPPAVFEDAVSWVPTPSLRAWFSTEYRAPGRDALAQAQLSAFTRHDVGDTYRDALALSWVAHAAWARGRKTPAAWRPERLQFGCRYGARAGWLNVDASPRYQPDVCADLADRASPLPWQWPQADGGRIVLEADQLEEMLVVEPPLAGLCLDDLLAQALRLVRPGGRLQLLQPSDPLLSQPWGTPEAWEERLGQCWRYDALAFGWQWAGLRTLNRFRQPCSHAEVAWWEVTMVKAPTDLAARCQVRAVRHDFGGLPEDEVFGAVPASAQPARPDAVKG